MTMNCKEIELALQLYMDGEFDEANRAEVEAHIRFCPHCHCAMRVTRRRCETFLANGGRW